MRAKLALALALAPRPALLILDEPTAGLDPVARREFMQLIVAQARQHQRTTIFSSHLIDEVERCADRVGIIHRGRMRFEGGIEELRQKVRRIVLPLGAAFEAVVPEMTQAEVRTLLAKFGLKADQVTSRVGRLSPGERTRAAMALLQARGVNLLVLDEPTNHLDLPAIEQLEQALESYDGALLLVSHDRRLLENVRLHQRWEVDGGHVAVRHS